jgi:hypothetical protein
MGLMVLVKKMSVLINFLLQNTILVDLCQSLAKSVKSAQILLVMSDRTDNVVTSVHAPYVINFVGLLCLMIFSENSRFSANKTDPHIRYTYRLYRLVGFMVLNATFNNISAISWRTVFLVKETRVPRENHRPVTSHRQTVSHIIK